LAIIEWFFEVSNDLNSKFGKLSHKNNIEASLLLRQLPPLAVELASEMPLYYSCGIVAKLIIITKSALGISRQSN